MRWVWTAADGKSNGKIIRTPLSRDLEYFLYDRPGSLPFCSLLPSIPLLFSFVLYCSSSLRLWFCIPSTLWSDISTFVLSTDVTIKGYFFYPRPSTQFHLFFFFHFLCSLSFLVSVLDSVFDSVITQTSLQHANIAVVGILFPFLRFTSISLLHQSNKVQFTDLLCRQRWAIWD